MTSTETAATTKAFEINDLVSSDVYPHVYAGRVLAVTEEGVLVMGLPYVGATTPTAIVRPAHMWQPITDGSRTYEATRTHFGQVLSVALAGAKTWQDSYQRKATEYDTFRDTVRTRMIEEAESRDWCEEFDRILEEFGLDPRTREFYVEVTITATQTISIPVTARDEDDAKEGVDMSSYSLSDYVSDTEWSWDSDDAEITDVTEAD